MKKVMEILEKAPVNDRNNTTDEYPPNFLVFLYRNGKKKTYIRMHPDYVSGALEDGCFTSESLDDFYDAWKYIEQGGEADEIIKIYATFIINKLSHICLTSRQQVIQAIQSRNITLMDFFITNN